MKVIKKMRHFLIHKASLPFIKFTPSIFFQAPLPKRINFEASNICNLRCRLCPTNTLMKRKKGNIELNNYKKIIDEISSFVEKLSFNFAGEPLCNPKIFKMVAYANKKGIKTYLSTNTTLLDKYLKEVFKSRLDEITVCLDGATKKTHEFYRRGSNFKKTVENIRKLTEMKKKLKNKKPRIELQFVVMKQNEKEIKEIIKLAKKLNIDILSLKTVSLGSLVSIKEQLIRSKKYLPKNNLFSRYKKTNAQKLEIKSQNTLCDWPIRQSVIFWNGDVTTCCYDFDGKLKIGNIFQDGGFKKIWFGKKYRKMRKNVLLKLPFLCKKCTRTANYGISIGKKELQSNSLPF